MINDLNLNEIDLLHPKLPKFKADGWKVIWICVLIFFLANTILMSIRESKQYRKQIQEMEAKHSEIMSQYSFLKDYDKHYHKFLSKEIQYRK